MQFNEIVGQYGLKQTFINNIQHKKMPHAMLLVGAEGTGALSITLATIQYLLCENRTEFDSCGVCSACKKVKKLIHPDIHFSKPVIKNPKITYKSGEENAAISLDWINEWRQKILENPYLSYNDWMQVQAGETNAQGNITARECGQILKFLSLKSFESGYKFVIIWIAEFLGKEGNRLLKQIEEPEDNTFFFLIAENYEQVLGTIQSRSQLIKLPPLSNEEITNALVEQKQIALEMAQSISVLADGNFNAALKLLKEKDDSLEKIFLDWMQIIIKKQKKDWVGWADQLAKLGRENQKQMIKYGLILLRQAMLFQNTNNFEIYNEREKAYCSYLAQKLSVDKLQQLSQLLDEMYFHIERNANPKILFTHNSFEIAELF
jgi:DNA polymerase-3 subunit delta'